ncbi:hypothetical protein SESBI_06455 [Sesbania bispinosa]|nr:hypothetical protein SESBI_06455 [Sesbania bispinosa]
MSKKVILEPVPSSAHRRQPLLRQRQGSGTAGTRLGEAVGGTAAVCCCGPCALANIAYLAIYKVPASLCQKALNKRKQRRRRHLKTASEGVSARPRCSCGCCDDFSVGVYPTCSADDDDVARAKARRFEEQKDEDVVELEKRCGIGFMVLVFGEAPLRETHPFPPLSHHQEG